MSRIMELLQVIGAYFRRINIKRRLVYQVIEETKTVRILRMWSHYGE
jgi:toxin YoeB